MALEPKSPAESYVQMSQLLLPGGANALGAAFGGQVTSWIDIAGAISAQRHCRQIVVTASMDDLHFHAPIKIGWQVNLKARVIAAFKTSVEVGVTVYSENPITGERALCTTALLTFVALDAAGNRLEVPPLQLNTPEERQAAHRAQQRREERLAKKGQAQEWIKLL
ncbi:MAG: acyl-CoA thioesterase [Myxococcaceae bacterium]